MINGIVLTHSDLGKAFVNTAFRIVGPANRIDSLSSAGLSPKDLKVRLEKIVERDDNDDKTIVFVGLKGGNPWHVACRVAKERPNISVISGLNLPMLLSFLTKRDELPLSGLLEILKIDALRGIDIFPGDA
ncbi:PTS system mannose-specific EIIAB component [bacterium BMS3Abin05]|nr:PTS system mannose-specific EIIAB component [bacterium BMS3Abin05]GBE26956.1 PTS system mannose-specific EIIAB component [bacterium BMS3Bbin03]HDL78900.1 hypothetical protein [Bacteroidota bacterium]HDZ11198.1 hypothetical protein [Bacteroidota bacterium]